MGFVSIVMAILAVGVLIIVHEGGHYLAARWGGMRVSRFSVGFGNVIYRRQVGETEFALSAIPLGGYVQIDGMHPEDGTDPNDPRAFANRPFGAKFGAIVAGPLANYLLAFVLFFIFFAFLNARPTPPIRVVDVVDGGAAAAAGIAAGDVILGVEGRPFDAMSDFTDAIAASDGQPIPFEVKRGEAEPIVIPVTPKEAAGAYLVGVRYEESGRTPDPQGVVAGIKLAGWQLWAESRGMLKGLSLLLTGAVGVEAVDGPPGIVKGLADQFRKSSSGALAFIGKFSVALGLFNLLPIPALDGGRLMFLLVGAIRRRPVEPKIEGMIHLAGFALLFGLLIFVSINDVFQ